MKARFFALAALVLGLASCQNDFDGANVGVGGEVDFQLSVNAPELATRAGFDGADDKLADLNSAYGAIDYLQAKDEGNPDLRTDWDDVNLRYTLEVYDKADSYAADVAPVKDRQVIIVDEYEPVTFELRLVPKRDYHFVVFADFVPQDVTDATQTSAIEAQRNIGLHHVIGNTLADITVKNDGINDECSDAYFATKDIVISNSAAQDIVLKRPYGKLRVVATDLHELNLNVNPVAVKVEYTALQPQTLNAVTGEIGAIENTVTTFVSEYNEGVCKEFDEKNGKHGLQNHFYNAGYDALNGANHEQHTNANGDVRHTHMTLFTDYILASEQQHSVHFTMTVYDDYANSSEIKSTTFNTDIPVQRNYLTTVIGNVLTTATEVEVRIDDNFAGEYTENLWDGSIKAPAYDAATKTYSIYETSELAWLAAVVNGEITRGAAQRNFAGETFKLMNDIGLDLNGDRWTPIGANSTVKDDTCFKGTFDGNGKTIYNLYVSTEGKASAGLFANCLGTIKNLTVKDAVIYGHYKAGVIVADGTCAKLENCHVDGAKIVVTPINNDDANNVGGIVGYLVADGGTAYVKNCSVKNAEISAYRKVAGIVGAANLAAVVTGNSVEDVTITADQTAEYKEFKAAEVGEIAGSIHEKAQVENNTVGENVKVVIKVDSNEEALPALTTKCKNLEVVLGADVEVAISKLGTQTSGSGEYKLGNEDTETITIDLGGKKLNITTTYWSAIGAKNNDALFTIKNGTMTSTGNSAGTWNAWDLRFSNCNYAFEDVVFEKAVALDNAAKTTTMKNVTITDTHNTDTYGLWITAEGQTVTLDGCTIDMTPATDGRGIKIDEQYVGAPAKVTLNVANTTFKTEEKAAILVKSKAGAEINASSLNIAEVVADTTFAVWVDADAAAYADKVVVNGALKKIENSQSEVIESPEDLADITIEDNATIVLSEGNYVIPAAAKGKTVTFIGSGNPEDTSVAVTKVGTGGENCDYGLDGSTVTFENITITTNSSTYIGYARCNGTYKNCIINGTYTLYGDSVFENCTLNVTGDVYNIWTWAAPNATFTNCTFNCDGKAMLLYGTANTNLTMNNCVFNDNGGLVDELKAAIEIGNDYGATYELVVNNATVNGFAINPKGTPTNTTLWANKNSMTQDKLNVVVDGVDVF